MYFLARAWALSNTLLALGDEDDEVVELDSLTKMGEDSLELVPSLVNLSVYF